MPEPSEPQTEAHSIPCIVTADTARRCRLWNRGRILLEDPFGTYRIGEISSDMTARSVPYDPEIESQTFQLMPARTLLFIPVDSRVMKRKDPSDA